MYQMKDNKVTKRWIASSIIRATTNKTISTVTIRWAAVVAHVIT